MLIVRPETGLSYPQPMPETPEQLDARAAAGLRTPPVREWNSWAFEGEVRPKRLAPLKAQDADGC